MPLNIEMGCDGKFHVTSDNDTRSHGSVTVRTDGLDAVHLAVDHHYRNYSKDRDLHKAHEVKGCPFCQRGRS